MRLMRLEMRTVCGDFVIDTCGTGTVTVEAEAEAETEAETEAGWQRGH